METSGIAELGARQALIVLAQGVGVDAEGDRSRSEHSNRIDPRGVRFESSYPLEKAHQDRRTSWERV